MRVSIHTAPDCEMEPTVVDDPDKWGKMFDAKSNFVDNVKDISAEPYNYWAGKNGAQVKFVYSLGCKAKVTEVHLRNSHNGKYLDRQLIQNQTFLIVR